MTDTERKVEKIVTHLGLESQMDVAQEELAELIQAISKLRRVMQRGLDTPENRAKYIAARCHAAEEVADVMNLMLQLIILLRIDDITAFWLEQKLDRTLDKIEKGEL